MEKKQHGGRTPLPPTETIMSQTFRAEGKTKTKEPRRREMDACQYTFTLEFPHFICTASNKPLTARFISNLGSLRIPVNKRWSRSYSKSITAQCPHCSTSGPEVADRHPLFAPVETKLRSSGGKGPTQNLPDENLVQHRGL